MIGFKDNTPFTIFTAKNPEATKHQIVVSKKVSKKAVERNRIKRRIKSVLQTTSTQKPLVIICRPSVLALSFSELKAALMHQLQSLSL